MLNMEEIARSLDLDDGLERCLQEKGFRANRGSFEFGLGSSHGKKRKLAQEVQTPPEPHPNIIITKCELKPEKKKPRVINLSLKSSPNNKT